MFPTPPALVIPTGPRHSEPSEESAVPAAYVVDSLRSAFLVTGEGTVWEPQKPTASKPEANEHYALLLKTCDGSTSTRPELSHAKEVLARK